MKRIFLTGASSGIGRAIAEALTRRGYQVWGTSRDSSRLPPLLNFHPVALDLSDESSIGAAFANAESEAGAFDVVINNAGSGHFGPAAAMPMHELRREFEVLVFGQIHLMQLALRGMRERNSGMMINVTSLASRLPLPFMASYNAAKAAMAVFTNSVQLELYDSDVRVIDLQPADIRTNFNAMVAKFGFDSPDYRERAEKTWDVADRNMRNAPGPEIVAHAVAELILNENPPPRVTVGDFFQSRVAPFIIRFLPMRLQLWGIAKYYGI